MKNARLALLLLLGAAACSSGARSVGARFTAPVAVVPFAGNLAKPGGGLRDYLAVASSRGDELNILDPSDEQPVLGPNAVFPLSVPTAPRPLRVAAAQLGDRDALHAADLLVAVSAGSLELQVVNTWDPAANAVDPARNVDLTAALGADGEILALTAVPRPDASGAARARVIAAGVGSACPAGCLAVVDFVREAKAGADPATLGVVPAPNATGSVVGVQPIGVRALDLAVEPGGSRIFAATRDGLVPGATPAVVGVMQIDSTDDASAAWATHPIDAHGPTLAVAAARVRERIVSSRSATAADVFDAAPDASLPLSVYAALDPDGCGPAHEIACGVATLRALGSVPGESGALADDVAADPSVGSTGPTSTKIAPMRFRQPMPVPGVPVAMVIVPPPANGTQRVSDSNNNALLNVITAFDTEVTSALAAVTSTDGHVYLFDLGRATPVNDLSLPISAAPAVVGGQVIPPATPAPTATVLGLQNTFPVVVPPSGAPPGVVADSAGIRSSIQVTPGFTLSNDWAVTWQGTLPNLSQQRGTLVANATGAFVAVQLETGAGATSDAAHWAVGAQVASGELGVRQGDFVDVACPSGAIPEVLVTAVLAAGTTQGNVLFPGGALQLNADPCGTGQLVTSVILTVRASGVVVTRGPAGAPRTEYAGRPPPFDAQNTPVPFKFAWQEEHPEQVTTGAAPLDAETLALARKARRVHYPIAPPCPASTSPGCYTNFGWLADPLAPGPVLAFQVGLVDIDANGAVVGPSAPNARPARDTQITFSTGTGFVQSSRRPIAAGVLPRGLAVVDRTKFKGHENEAVRIYATYLDDALISFMPTDVAGLVHTIR
jgi:hypothetical protein